MAIGSGLKKTKRKKTSHRVVDIGRVHANSWNPNKMPVEFYTKLKKGIEKLVDKDPSKVPPIIVRKLACQVGHYEIIDGYHRWRAFSELGREKIGVFVIHADDKSARILTNTLNYLRGEPDREKYTQNIVELLELGADVSDLGDLIPEDEDGIEDLLSEANISVEAYKQLYDAAEENAENDRFSEDDSWVELKYKVSLSQAKVIGGEIARIGKKLKGKNVEGRALEFMAVQSAQTPLPEDL